MAIGEEQAECDRAQGACLDAASGRSSGRRGTRRGPESRTWCRRSTIPVKVYTQASCRPPSRSRRCGSRRRRRRRGPGPAARRSRLGGTRRGSLPFWRRKRRWVERPAAYSMSTSHSPVRSVADGAGDRLWRGAGFERTRVERGRHDLLVPRRHHVGVDGEAGLAPRSLPPAPGRSAARLRRGARTRRDRSSRAAPRPTAPEGRRAVREADGLDDRGADAVDGRRGGRQSSRATRSTAPTRPRGRASSTSRRPRACPWPLPCRPSSPGRSRGGARSGPRRPARGPRARGGGPRSAGPAGTCRRCSPPGRRRASRWTLGTVRISAAASTSTGTPRARACSATARVLSGPSSAHGPAKM